MKPVIVDENIPFLPEILRQKYEVITFSGRELTREKILAAEAENLFVRSTIKANADLLGGTGVKFIVTATAGDDHFDKDFMHENGIYFSNAAGSNSNSVAEYAVYAILTAYEKRNRSPRGETIGIVGFGNIGSKLAHYCHALGMHVLVNDPPLRAAGATFPDYCEYAELGELIENSDVVSNHVPRIRSGEYCTMNLFNAENLRRLKSSGVFIHASRGGVANETALCEFLAKNPAADLIIDVYAGEPQPNEALALRAIIATPHVAGHAFNGKLLGTLMVLQAYKDFSGATFDESLIEANSRQSDFNGTMPSEEILLAKIAEYRNISSDIATFRRLFTLEQAMQPAEFDRERRYYPVRYEYLKIIK